jgi:hypothetical protein
MLWQAFVCLLAVVAAQTNINQANANSFSNAQATNGGTAVSTGLAEATAMQTNEYEYVQLSCGPGCFYWGWTLVG